MRRILTHKAFSVEIVTPFNASSLVRQTALLTSKVVVFLKNVFEVGNGWKVVFFLFAENVRTLIIGSDDAQSLVTPVSVFSPVLVKIGKFGKFREIWPPGPPGTPIPASNGKSREIGHFFGFFWVSPKFASKFPSSPPETPNLPGGGWPLKRGGGSGGKSECT